MTEWMDRDNKDGEIKRDKFGGIIGETHETPGMVRWVSGPCHYFIKHNSPGRPIFALGFEHRIGDLAYIFDTSIEFDDDEAPDLMDRIADFQGLPKYTDLLKTREALEHILVRLAGPMYSSGVSKGAIVREIMRALKGEKIEDV